VADQPWSDTLAAAVTAVLAQPGGDQTVIDSLARIPHTRWVELKTGWFSRVSMLELGDRRLRANGDGRLYLQHVVGDVAVSCEPRPRPYPVGATAIAPPAPPSGAAM